MDSGVGVVGERGSSRFCCEGNSGVSSIWSFFVCPGYHAKLGISLWIESTHTYLIVA